MLHSLDIKIKGKMFTNRLFRDIQDCLRERSNMISRHEGGVGNCKKKRDNHYITSLNKKRDNGGDVRTSCFDREIRGMRHLFTYII